jgi:hypothetical protein
MGALLVLQIPMPSEHKADRRRRIPKMAFKVRT